MSNPYKAPWEQVATSRGYFIGSASMAVAHVPYKDEFGQRCARLIEIAPQMLELLEDYLRAVDLHTDVMTGQIDADALEAWMDAWMNRAARITAYANGITGAAEGTDAQA